MRQSQDYFAKALECRFAATGDQHASNSSKGQLLRAGCSPRPPFPGTSSSLLPGLNCRHSPRTFTGFVLLCDDPGAAFDTFVFAYGGVDVQTVQPALHIGGHAE